MEKVVLLNDNQRAIVAYLTLFLNKVLKNIKFWSIVKIFNVGNNLFG